MIYALARRGQHVARRDGFADAVGPAQQHPSGGVDPLEAALALALR